MNQVTKQTYLPFAFDPEAINERWLIAAEPQEIFKPIALMIWGATPATMIEQILIGRKVQGASGMGKLPALFFSTAKNYEKLVEDFKLNGISPPTWVTFDTIHLGDRAEIIGSGPISAAVFLGKSLR